jgi:hypothetical protein
MEYHSIIFYFSLFLGVVCIAEIYVRMKGMGDKVEKDHGRIVPVTPKLAAPIVLLIAALVVTVMTSPR